MDSRRDTELFFTNNFIVDKKGSHHGDNSQMPAKINGHRFMKRNNVSAIIINVSGKGDARRLKSENQQKLMRLLRATCNLAFSLGDAHKCHRLHPLSSHFTPSNPFELQLAVTLCLYSLDYYLSLQLPTYFSLPFLSRCLKAFTKQRRNVINS